MNTTVAKGGTVKTATVSDDYQPLALTPAGVSVSAKGFAKWLPGVLRNVNQNSRGL